jgi:DHA1 family tetracycline resistance protein-like MFS transporter
MPPAPRRAAFTFIFVTVFLDMMALGMMVPVLPKYVERLTGDPQSAAFWFGLMGMSWALMQFIFSPIQGALSDQIGRKPVVILSNLGMAVSYAATALAQSVPILFIARVISGISAASVSTAYAYIADVYPPEDRPRYFGFLGAGFGLGFIVGPLIGGSLASIDPHVPFWTAALMCGLNALYGMVVLPESLAPENRKKFQIKRANPFAFVSYLKQRPQVSGLIGSTSIAYFAQAVLPSTMVLYGSFRFGWSEMQAGYVLGAVGLAAVCVQAGLAGRVNKLIGAPASISVGLLSGVAGFCIYAFAPEPWVFYLGIPMVALWGLAGPSVQTLLTSRIPANEQGQLQGTMASLQGAAGIFAPVAYTSLFAFFIGTSLIHFPGAPFLLAAMCLFVAWLFARSAARPISLASGPQAL